MLPSQLQYKDVITRILPGFLLGIVITFFILYFYRITEADFKSWFSIDWKEFLLLFLPVALAVSYAIGSAIGSIHFMLIQIAYGYPEENEFDGGKYIYRFTRKLYRNFFRLNRKSSEKDPRFEPLTSDKFEYYIELRKRISRKLGYDLDLVRQRFDYDKNRFLLTRVFDSCMNYNRAVSSSQAVGEIQRYSIIMEFNSQLSIIFSICFLGSIISFFSCVEFKYHFFWLILNRSCFIWMGLSICFYYFARKCANKSIRDWKERCNMIYYTFYHLSVIKESNIEEKSKDSEDSKDAD